MRKAICKESGPGWIRTSDQAIISHNYDNLHEVLLEKRVGGNPPYLRVPRSIFRHG
jgi:hypothetical protein